MEFSPDGRIVAGAEQEGVRLWDVAAGEAIAYLPVGHTRTVLFTPDGRALITSSTRGLWRWPIARDTAAPRGRKRIGPPERFPASAPAGCLYAAQSRDGSVLSASGWERDGTFADRTYVLRRSGRVRLATFPGHPDAHLVAISPDGRWVATCAWHGTGVRVWDTRRNGHARELQRETRAFPSFSSDGRWLVIATPREYRFWQVGTWRPGLRIPRERGSTSPGMTAFSRDGHTLALAHSGGNQVRLVHPATGRELAILEGPNPVAGQWFSFSPDGSMLAAADGDGGLQLWDLRRIRARLASMGLDWDLPSCPPSVWRDSVRPLTLRVVAAE